MYRARTKGHTHALAWAALLGCSLLVVGCATETKTQAKPAVVDEAPPAVVAEVPKAPPAPAPAPAPVKSAPTDAPEFWQHVAELRSFHQYENGIRWRLGPSGIELDGAVIEGHKVDSRVIQKVWDTYGETIERWSTHYGVPFEIIMTTICVESKGNARARNNKNYGMMQILVPTARSALSDQSLTEESLYDPNTAIKAGTAYMSLQKKSTRYDPPKVAAAYNAGSLRSASNPWGMRQYGPHLDKTVLWFNAVLAFVASKSEVPPVSFADYFRRHP